jgi:N-acetyl-anhydromuramyl-L-alanine amidase AmpD
MMLPDIYRGTQKLISPLSMSAGPMIDVEGVTIHDTADIKVGRLIDSLVSDGLGYHIIIDRDGTVIQTTYFSQRVNHAGVAKWNGASPNRQHIAVSLVSWGAVSFKDKKYYAWNGSEVPGIQVAKRKGNVNETVYNWHAATAEQEKSLMTFLRWCLLRGIKRENICGHDECALPSGRKSDPGGVLSMSMAQLRERLGEAPGDA